MKSKIDKLIDTNNNVKEYFLYIFFIHMNYEGSPKKRKGDLNLLYIVHNTSILTTRPQTLLLLYNRESKILYEYRRLKISVII